VQREAAEPHDDCSAPAHAAELRSLDEVNWAPVLHVRSGIFTTDDDERLARVQAALEEHDFQRARLLAAMLRSPAMRQKWLSEVERRSHGTSVELPDTEVLEFDQAA
jgi:hypothetical protein